VVSIEKPHFKLFTPRISSKAVQDLSFDRFKTLKRARKLFQDDLKLKGTLALKGF